MADDTAFTIEPGLGNLAIGGQSQVDVDLVATEWIVGFVGMGRPPRVGHGGKGPRSDPGRVLRKCLVRWAFAYRDEASDSIHLIKSTFAVKNRRPPQIRASLRAD